jgi:hypothetical protein
MPRTNASRLRPLVAAIGILTYTLAGAGGDNNPAGRPAAIGDSAIHASPRDDTPHDSFAAAAIEQRHTLA